MLTHPFRNLFFVFAAVGSLAVSALAQSGTLTRLEQDDPSIRYTGTWYSNSESTNSGGSAALTNAKDAEATIIFNGTGITWIGYSDAWNGIAWLYLDGTLTVIDTYSANPQPQRNLFSVRGLAAGSHNLTIQVPHARGPNALGAWVWIDAFDVENGSGIPGGVAATAGRSEQSSPAITYDGQWFANSSAALSGGTASMGINPGSLATLIFNGTGVSWIGYGDPWSGIAQVSVDGTPKATVDTYRSTTQAQVSMYSISGLAAGDHTLTIVVTGTHSASSQGSWVWVDAFDVTNSSSGPPPPPPPPPAPGPAITSGGMMNGASFASAPAPGSIVSLFGSAFANSNATAASVPLPSSLGTTSVRVNGIAAPLFYVSPAQINFQMPWELAGQTQVSVTVTNGSATSPATSLSLAAVAPGIFTTNSSGSGQAAALISGTASIAATQGAFPGSRPISRGEFLSIYCTGLGQVSNQPATGQVGPSGTTAASTPTNPIVMIGAVAAAVNFSGLAPGVVGLYQVNVQIPQQAPVGPQVPITIQAGGITSNVATIAIQ